MLEPWTIALFLPLHTDLEVLSGLLVPHLHGHNREAISLVLHQQCHIATVELR